MTAGEEGVKRPGRKPTTQLSALQSRKGQRGRTGSSTRERKRYAVKAVQRSHVVAVSALPSGLASTTT
jgi:hypothetical protein